MNDNRVYTISMIFQNSISMWSVCNKTTKLPWGADGTVGSARVSHHSDSGWIPAPCSSLIKVTLVTCEKSVVQFDSTKHRRFSPGTLVSSCSNTGPVRGGP